MHVAVQLHHIPTGEDLHNAARGAETIAHTISHCLWCTLRPQPARGYSVSLPCQGVKASHRHSALSTAPHEPVPRRDFILVCHAGLHQCHQRLKVLALSLGTLAPASGGTDGAQLGSPPPPPPMISQEACDSDLLCKLHACPLQRCVLVVASLLPPCAPWLRPQEAVVVQAHSRPHKRPCNPGLHCKLTSSAVHPRSRPSSL